MRCHITYIIHASWLLLSWNSCLVCSRMYGDALRLGLGVYEVSLQLPLLLAFLLPSANRATWVLLLSYWFVLCSHTLDSLRPRRGQQYVSLQPPWSDSSFPLSLYQACLGKAFVMILIRCLFSHVWMGCDLDLASWAWVSNPSPPVILNFFYPSTKRISGTLFPWYWFCVWSQMYWSQMYWSPATLHALRHSNLANRRWVCNHPPPYSSLSLGGALGIL